MVIGVALYLGMPPTDLKLVSAVIVTIALAMGMSEKIFLSGRKDQRQVKEMLKIENLTKIFAKGTINEMTALDGVNFHGASGDFITIIGSNGAGKSTLMNSIAGVFPVDSGKIVLDGKDMSDMPEHKRAKMIGRVFQDPLKGTAFDMTIEENLSIAYNKKRRRGLQAGISRSDRELFKEKLALLGMGLEDRMKEKVRLLSGGQRQALTLFMAVIAEPKLLLLDEHTARWILPAAKKVLELTVYFAD